MTALPAVRGVTVNPLALTRIQKHVTLNIKGNLRITAQGQPHVHQRSQRSIWPNQRNLPARQNIEAALWSRNWHDRILRRTLVEHLARGIDHPQPEILVLPG